VDVAYGRRDHGDSDPDDRAVSGAALSDDPVGLVGATLWTLFNLMGLPYPGAYDNFLIGVSIFVCGAIIWYAWIWPAAG
jgi:hypothetical protein